jgi:hypothetical protein
MPPLAWLPIWAKNHSRAGDAAAVLIFIFHFGPLFALQWTPGVGAERIGNCSLATRKWRRGRVLPTGLRDTLDRTPRIGVSWCFARGFSWVRLTVERVAPRCIVMVPGAVAWMWAETP